MARTIDYLTLMVGVTPYEYEGYNYDALCIIVAFRRGRGFCITWQPVKIQPNGYMTGPMPSRDPLVGGGGFVAKEASRNSVRTLEMMRASLQLARHGIKFYFDQRNFDALRHFMGDAASYGYTAMLEERLMGDQRRAAYFPQTNNSSTPKNGNHMKLNLSNNRENNVLTAQVINPQTSAASRQPSIEDAVAEEIVEDSPAPSGPTTETATVTEGADKTGSPAERSESFPVAEERKQGLPKVTFSTYKTKRGDTAPQIIGFAGEDDPRWLCHKGSKCISASFRRDINGEKVYILMFGVRYMDVAKALAGAYNTDDVNAWHRAEDAVTAIYEQAQRDGKARWEEKKAKWAAAAAEKKDLRAKAKQGKSYTPEEVAAMLRAIGNGGDVPDDIAAAMKKVA